MNSLWLPYELPIEPYELPIEPYKLPIALYMNSPLPIGLYETPHRSL